MLRMVELKKDDTRNILSDIQLFEGLTPAQLDWVSHRAHRRVFPHADPPTPLLRLPLARLPRGRPAL